MRQPRFIQMHEHDAAALAAEATAGLAASPASVSPKFFYDTLGSRLFEAITALDEYYPTRTEAAVLEQHGEAIARTVLGHVGPGATLIDLGAGNCAKAARLLVPLRAARYVAVDISAEFLREALAVLQQRHPAIEMTGVGADFATRLALAPEVGLDAPGIVFYPGSSIGNFAPAQALRLLREARVLARGGALLIGVDLVKPRDVLERAYDDALGVTAAFNLNLLRHLNRLAATDFDVRDWRHVALYDAAHSRIEMHLEARRALLVRWPGGERRFAAAERVHTEHSYKWRVADFAGLLAEAGFADVRTWTDDRQWFAVVVARAPAG